MATAFRDGESQFDTPDELIAYVKELFGDSDLEANAWNELESLRMRKRTFQEYYADFRSIVADIPSISHIYLALGDMCIKFLGKRNLFANKDTMHCILLLRIMNRSIEQTLSTLIPRHPGFLPTTLACSFRFSVVYSNTK
jgi:hypothetical protein